MFSMVKNIAKGAWRGARMALAEGESGWVNIDAGGAISATGSTSNAGTVVSGNTAMCLSAVWSCVRNNAQLIGSLPVNVYERQKNGTRVRIEPDIAEVLTSDPNLDQTGMEFWEGQTSQLSLQGNSYSEKLLIGNRIVGLRPLFNVTPKRRADGRFEYKIRERGKSYILPPEKVFHVRGFGAGDGMGLSTIKFGVQSIGSAIAADEAAARMFSGGMMASGVLTSDQLLTPEQREQLQTMLDTFRGSKQQGKIMTLEAGLGFSQLQINPEDAQLLDTRRFSVEDVCRWFGVPPIIIGHAAQGQTMWGTGVEAIMLAWLTLGINPSLRRIEKRVQKELIPREKRRTWFLEWNREAMLQMDSKAKADFLSRLSNSGIMTRDESRDKLNLPRRGGTADELTVQTALTTIDLLGKEGQ